MQYQSMFTELFYRLSVGVLNLGRGITGPTVVEQYDGPLFVCAIGDTGVEHLLIEGNH